LIFRWLLPGKIHNWFPITSIISSGIPQRQQTYFAQAQNGLIVKQRIVYDVGPGFICHAQRPWSQRYRLSFSWASGQKRFGNNQPTVPVFTSVSLLTIDWRLETGDNWLSHFCLLTSLYIRETVLWQSKISC
jgi:hypothetical protein